MFNSVVNMSYRKCCIPGCPGTENVLHQFPNPSKHLDRFMEWLNRIGGDAWNLSNEFIYKNRRVCRIHFETKHHCRNNRLSNIAVPTINMPCSTVQRPLQQIHNLPISNFAASNEILIESVQQRPIQCDVLSQGKENIGPSSSSSNALDHKSCPDVENIINKIQQKVNTKRRKVNLKMTTRRMKMTKSEQQLYNKLISEQKKLRKCKNKLAYQGEQIKLAKNLCTNSEFLKVMESLPASAKILFMLQFREHRKKAKGIRFNLQEKILSLSIFKQSPKAYRFIRKFLSLPSPQTLKKLLSRANIKPGINKKIFMQLKRKASEMKSTERLCILIYDEMSLKINVTYNEKKDNITGFVNNGEEIKPIYANHAQVFMIRGLHTNYKQPVSYTFCAGATKGPELARQVKEIIYNLQKAGLKVVTTICDQATNNRQAIRYLINETRADQLRRGESAKDNVFMVNGQEIVPLYDPPHLLKGIRNNLLTKNLQYEISGEVKVAKWHHLELLHKENPGYKGVRLVPKLTDHHIVPQKIGKMKVKYASQVFSSAVASNMGYLADKKILPEECKETADILLFFDELFDSVNGSFVKKNKFAKPLLGPATPTSVHHKTWTEGKKVLKSMKYINRSGKKEVVPTINIWLWTLEGIEVLLKMLEKDYGITSVWMRHFNQDPIENFFGAIRAHGCRNTNPTPERFESAFATLNINSLSSVHTPGRNCEHDLGEALITLFELDDDCKADDDSSYVLEDILSISLEPIDAKRRDPKIWAPLQYISGYFIKKTKTIYKSCETCKRILVAREPCEYITYREYANRRWLCSPSEQIISIISNIQDVAMAVLQTNLEMKNIKQYLITVIYILVDLKNISCPSHKDKVIKYLINAVSRFFIYNYCKIINKILCGKKDVDDLSDKYQIMAKNYYQKSLKMKKK